MSNEEKVQKHYLVKDGMYYPSIIEQTTKTLPAGVFDVHVTMQGDVIFEPINIVTDEIVPIPNSFAKEVVSEIDTFWSDSVSKKFKQYGLVQKRGILLEGKPGCGKTICLAEAAKTVITNHEAVVLFNPSVRYLASVLRLIKDIEPTKKVMVMWEEFDSVLHQDESSLLSILDGEIQIDNVIYLATTNYISQIPARIKNRPSRFAKIISVGTPDEAARKAYLEAKLTEDDKTMIPQLLQASEGFVIDQLKDMIISVCVFGYPVADAANKIKEMQSDSVGYADYQENEARAVFKRYQPVNYDPRAGSIPQTPTILTFKNPFDLGEN